jgi:cytochrome c oxidase cbb3-type subunit II
MTGCSNAIPGAGAQLRRPARVTEMDALIAYMQMLGTLVDFSTFTPDASR